jgi:DNA-binding PadR family transcriptional regulator
MRTRNSDYAILGMLSLEPMSGYEIKRAIEQSVAHFWRESFGQIYPTLKRLVAEGLIRSVSERPGDKNGRQSYALTAAGRKHLRTWLAQTSEPQPPRNQLMLKLFFGSAVPTDVTRQHLQEFRRRQEESLAALTALEKQLNAVDSPSVDTVYWQITLSHSLHRARAELRWCDEALARISSLAKPHRKTAARARSK